MPSARRICGSSSTTSTRRHRQSAAAGSVIDHREPTARRVVDRDLAAHASTNPRRPRARGRRRRRRVVAERWNGWKTCSRCSGGMPGPSTTRSSTRLADRAGVDPHGPSGGDQCSALATRLATARSSSAASAWTRGSVSATSTSRPWPRVAEALRARRDDLVEADGAPRRARARRPGGGSCRAGCPTSVVEPVGLLVDRREELVASPCGSSRRRAGAGS